MPSNFGRQENECHPILDVNKHHPLLEDKKHHDYCPNSSLYREMSNNHSAQILHYNREMHNNHPKVDDYCSSTIIIHFWMKM